MHLLSSINWMDIAFIGRTTQRIFHKIFYRRKSANDNKQTFACHIQGTWTDPPDWLNLGRSKIFSKHFNGPNEKKTDQRGKI